MPKRNYQNPTGKFAPNEHAEQVAVFQWIAVMTSTHPAFEAAFAIPNGGYRHIITGRKLKAEGVRAGVPDIFIAFPIKRHKGLFIEMKRANGVPSDVSAEQHEWIARLQKNGYKVCVCYGEKQARKAICEYLGVQDRVIDQ